MSHTRRDELAASVHDRLVACAPRESLSVLAEFAAAALAVAPGPQRALARALFIDAVDRALAERGPGHARGERRR